MPERGEVPGSRIGERVGVGWLTGSCMACPQYLAGEANSCELILDTVPVDLPWAEYVRALKPNGSLSIVGAAPGEVRIPAIDLIDGQKSICGSAMGSLSEIDEMFRFSAKHGIMPMIELYPMKEVNRGLERVRANRVRYRAVLVNRA